MPAAELISIPYRDNLIVYRHIETIKCILPAHVGVWSKFPSAPHVIVLEPEIVKPVLQVTSYAAA